MRWVAWAPTRDAPTLSLRRRCVMPVNHTLPAYHPLLVCTLLILAAVVARGEEWPYYAADAKSSKYAPLSQIDGNNFARLQEVWRYTAPDKEIAERHYTWTDTNKGTPLMVDGVLYYGSPFNILCAVDPTSGEELWTFDPKVWENRDGFTGILRGVAYWSSGDKKRIFYATSTDRLYSIDVETGQPDPEFGAGGFADLSKGLRRDIDRSRYCVTSAPIVCRDVVVVGSAIVDWHGESPAEYSTPGDVRGFDAHTRRTGVGLSDGAAGRRARQRHLGKRRLSDLWPSQCVGCDECRRRAGLRVPARQQHHPQLLRRRASRGQPLQSNAGLPQGGNRRARLALPTHPPRPVELRPASTASLGRYQSSRQSNQGTGPGDQTSLLLCIRPHYWRTSLAH